MWILDVIANLSRGKSASMNTEDHKNLLPSTDDVDVQESGDEEEGPIDSFCGHTTIVFYEDGTSALYDHKNVDADLAADLLGARNLYSYYSPVDMKYYGSEHPNLKIYLKRNRVTLGVNRAFKFHFNIAEKGPIVVHNMDSAKKSWVKFIPLGGTHPVLTAPALLVKSKQSKVINIPNQLAGSPLMSSTFS